MHRPHAEQARHDIQASHDGTQDQEDLQVVPEAIDADPHRQERCVDEDERGHVAVQQQGERLVKGYILNVFTQRHPLLVALLHLENSHVVHVRARAYICYVINISICTYYVINISICRHTYMYTQKLFAWPLIPSAV